MAKENGEPTAAEKGKGKAVDEQNVNGDKKGGDLKTDKDGLPIINGKKGEDTKEGTATSCELGPELCADQRSAIL